MNLHPSTQLVTSGFHILLWWSRGAASTSILGVLSSSLYYTAQSGRYKLDIFKYLTNVLSLFSAENSVIFWSRGEFGCAFVCVYSQKYFSFIVWASPPQILLLFSLLYPVVIVPLEGLLESIFLQSLKTSFLAFAFSLQMSKSKIMVHCWCFGKGGVGKGVCSLYTVIKSTHFTCSVRDLVCTNSSSLLASTRSRHWNSKQAFWKLSVFSDPFPHIKSKQIFQGTLWTWCKSK